MPMPSARTLCYRARKAELVGLLGGKCRVCPNTVELEFDCIKPMGHAHHVTGSMGRIAFYELMHEHGNVQLLCRRHHREKTADEKNRRCGPWYPMI